VALLDALKRGHLFRAGLDVFAHEPPSLDISGWG
jgi:phosphoglycerate dehydrogenase-like enzyme